MPVAHAEFYVSAARRQLKTIMHMSYKTAVTAIALCIAFQVQSEILFGKVIHIQDGDTITVMDGSQTSHRVRLAGIDAPEKKQSFGRASTGSLQEQIAGQAVTVEWSKTDRYVWRLTFENGRARNQRCFLLKLSGTENRLVLTLNVTVLAFIPACSRFIATCSNYLKMKTSPLGYIGSPALSIFSRNSVALAGSSVLLNKALTSAVLASNNSTKSLVR